MSEVIFNDANFQEQALKSEKPVLVDFYATWCGPCRLQGPIVEELSEEMGDKVIIGKLDVDANPQVSQKYTVMSIPTIIIFKKGEAVKTLIGLQTKESLKKELESII